MNHIDKLFQKYGAKKSKNKSICQIPIKMLTLKTLLLKIGVKCKHLTSLVLLIHQGVSHPIQFQLSIPFLHHSWWNNSFKSIGAHNWSARLVVVRHRSLRFFLMSWLVQAKSSFNRLSTSTSTLMQTCFRLFWSKIWRKKLVRHSLPLVNSSCFTSSMTWTCQLVILMTPKMPLHFWDNTEIMSIGMIKINLHWRISISEFPNEKSFVNKSGLKNYNNSQSIKKWDQC